MGYYSSYEKLSEFTEEQEKALWEILGYELDADADYLAYEVKWYEHEKHLKLLSEKYPNTLFSVERIGEEYPDIERIYAKDGKVLSLTPSIIWPEFKEEDLK